MKTILSTIDFSETSLSAVKYAASLAAKKSWSLQLVHVLHPMDNIDNNIYNVLYYPDYMAFKKEKLEQIIAKLKTTFPALKNHIDYTMLHGNSASEIHTYAKKIKPALIVLGSTGAGAIERFFFGTTVASLLEKSEIPVLVVPPTFRFKIIKNLALAFDTDLNINQASKSLLQELAELSKGPIHLVHIENKTLQSGYAQVIKDAKQVFQTSHINTHVLKDKKLERALRIFCESVDSNMLVMIKQKHNLIYKLVFRLESQAVLNALQLPILFVKEG